MPSVIDELVVTLGLDTSKFSGQASQATSIANRAASDVQRQGTAIEQKLARAHQDSNKRLKESQESLRNASFGVQGFQRQVASLFAVMAGGYGFQQFMKNLVNTDASIGRTAKNIGMSASELNVWQEAAKRAGGSAEGITGFLSGMSQEYQKLSITGESSIVPWFRTLGIAISDAQNHLRPFDDLLRDLANKFHGMSGPEANFFGSMIGADQGTIQLLMKGGDALEEIKEHIRSLGFVTKEQADQAAAFDAKWADVIQTMKTLGRAILYPLLPTIEHLIDVWTKWISDPANQKFIADTVTKDIQKFSEMVNNVISQISEWKKTFLDWKDTAETIAKYIGGAWVIRMMAGFGPIGLAVAALAVGWLALQKAMHPQDPHSYAPDSPLWQGIPEDQQLQYENSPASRQKQGVQGQNPYGYSAWNPGSSGWLANMAGRLGITGPSDSRQASVRDALATDLGISKEAASGIVSNLNAESGIQGINEKHPLVPGSRGGFGWAQWTGPRRDDFENWASQNKLDPASDAANYGFLVSELRGKYPGVLSQLKRGDITATEAANIVARQYVVPPADKLPEHIASAERVAGLRSSGPGPRATLGTVGDDASKTADWVGDSVRKYLQDASPWLTSPANGGNPASPVGQQSSNNVETHINGPITINTQAKDADGIARDLNSSLQKYSYVSQANLGLA